MWNFADLLAIHIHMSLPFFFNFTQDLTEVKIFQKSLGGYFISETPVHELFRVCKVSAEKFQLSIILKWEYEPVRRQLTNKRQRTCYYCRNSRKSLVWCKNSLVSEVLVLVTNRISCSFRRHTGITVLSLYTAVDKHERWVNCLSHSTWSVNTPLQTVVTWSQSHLCISRVYEQWVVVLATLSTTCTL